MWKRNETDPEQLMIEAEATELPRLAIRQMLAIPPEKLFHDSREVYEAQLMIDFLKRYSQDESVKLQDLAGPLHCDRSHVGRKVKELLLRLANAYGVPIKVQRVKYTESRKTKYRTVYKTEFNSFWESLINRCR